MAEGLHLRWLDVRDPTSGSGRHEVVNALTAVCTAASLLDDRWDDLDEEQRRDLTATLRRRAEQLRALFSLAQASTSG